MNKKVLLLTVVVFSFCGSTVFALDPMGPPSASLAKGQFSARVN